MDRQNELEAFKTSINLTAYAASQGYELDVKATSRNSAVMVDAKGDKLIMGMGSDGHWIYFSVRDDRDHGSIIDFAQRRGGGSLGEVRKQLRPYLDSPPAPPQGRYTESLEPISHDLVKVRAAMQAMYPMKHCRKFLEEARQIPATVLDSARFAGRIYTDGFSNAVFPHWNDAGLCGYELKNQGFTGFAPGGHKGLWGSRSELADNTLVVSETAIDALSYAALFGLEARRFVSSAGQLNPHQPELLVRAAKKLSAEGAEVILALDNDQAGHALGEKLMPILGDVLPCRTHYPPTADADWNDELTEQ